MPLVAPTHQLTLSWVGQLGPCMAKIQLFSRTILPYTAATDQLNSVSADELGPPVALFSLTRPAGRPAGRTDGSVKIMPLVPPTRQLTLSWYELSWSVGAVYGNIYDAKIWCIKSLGKYMEHIKEVHEGIKQLNGKHFIPSWTVLLWLWTLLKTLIYKQASY